MKKDCFEFARWLVQFDQYVDRDLFIGFDENFASDIKLANKYGSEKKPQFLFEGFESRLEAESIIGKTIFASITDKDPINLISPRTFGLFSCHSLWRLYR